MIDSIKAKLWELLKEKDVSLAMLYNRDGEILWHKGRTVIGKTIDEAGGFSRSCVKRTLGNRTPFETENVVVSSVLHGLPESASVLRVKCVMIQPVNDEFYLYIDSGTRSTFSQSDREIFKFMGRMLEEIVERIKTESGYRGRILAKSREMKRIRELVLKFSLEEEPVLLLGETGVGKTYLAELIHQYSGRKGKFITVNIPAIPDTLFESEIFGHKKGAFTDARCDKRGLVDEAASGTLFLDEVSEIPPAFQAKFLRFIETKKYLILGDTREKEADVRIVAATNKDLNLAMEEKEFRQDLYFRLSVLEINIPPLRQRKEDMEALVKDKLNVLKGKCIGEGFWEAIYDYDWPGNVRELITVMTRAGILLNSPITGKGIREIIEKSSYKKVYEEQTHKIERIWEQMENGENFWELVKKPFLDRDLNREEVKEIIRSGLVRASGKYKNLLELFNLRENEYKRFMKFLNGNRLNI